MGRCLCSPNTDADTVCAAGAQYNWTRLRTLHEMQWKKHRDSTLRRLRKIATSPPRAPSPPRAMHLKADRIGTLAETFYNPVVRNRGQVRADASQYDVSDSYAEPVPAGIAECKARLNFAKQRAYARRQTKVKQREGWVNVVATAEHAEWLRNRGTAASPGSSNVEANARTLLDRLALLVPSLEFRATLSVVWRWRQGRQSHRVNYMAAARALGLVLDKWDWVVLALSFAHWHATNECRKHRRLALRNISRKLNVWVTIAPVRRWKQHASQVFAAAIPLPAVPDLGKLFSFD